MTVVLSVLLGLLLGLVAGGGSMLAVPVFRYGLDKSKDVAFPGALLVVGIASVVGLVLYAREAHPGARIGPHQTMQEKESAAGLLKQLDGENRRVLIDGLEGEFHQRLGALPNSVFLIDPEGIIRFRGDWNNPWQLEQAMAEIFDSGSTQMTETLNPNLPGPRRLFSVLLRGGWVAVWDFFVSMPGFVRYRIDKALGR